MASKAGAATAAVSCDSSDPYDCDTDDDMRPPTPGAARPVSYTNTCPTLWFTSNTLI